MRKFIGYSALPRIIAPHFFHCIMRFDIFMIEHFLVFVLPRHHLSMSDVVSVPEVYVLNFALFLLLRVLVVLHVLPSNGVLLKMFALFVVCVVNTSSLS